MVREAMARSWIVSPTMAIADPETFKTRFHLDVLDRLVLVALAQGWHSAGLTSVQCRAALVERLEKDRVTMPYVAFVEKARELSALPWLYKSSEQSHQPTKTARRGRAPKRARPPQSSPG